MFSSAISVSLKKCTFLQHGSGINLNNTPVIIPNAPNPVHIKCSYKSSYLTLTYLAPNYKRQNCIHTVSNYINQNIPLLQRLLKGSRDE